MNVSRRLFHPTLGLCPPHSATGTSPGTHLPPARSSLPITCRCVGRHIPPAEPSSASHRYGPTAITQFPSMCSHVPCRTEGRARQQHTGPCNRTGQRHAALQLILRKRTLKSPHTLSRSTMSLGTQLTARLRRAVCDAGKSEMELKATRRVGNHSTLANTCRALITENSFAVKAGVDRLGFFSRDRFSSRNSTVLTGLPSKQPIRAQ